LPGSARQTYRGGAPDSAGFRFDFAFFSAAR
jgi:hypothetical protein